MSFKKKSIDRVALMFSGPQSFMKFKLRAGSINVKLF